VRCVDTASRKTAGRLSEHFWAAIEKRLERGEQSLVFLNRRGYAPVLACPPAAGFQRCPLRGQSGGAPGRPRLRCHHCGFEERVPKAPARLRQSGHPPLRPRHAAAGRVLAERFPQARILRVDRDRPKPPAVGSVLEPSTRGEADILVGTQMLAKGHDFPLLTLVGVLGADAALFAADWRAPERLFAQLMQVAGRSGRAALPGEVLIQTQYPITRSTALVGTTIRPLPRPAGEREQAGFPPLRHQAMLRAEAPEMADSLAFLTTARGLAAASWPRTSCSTTRCRCACARPTLERAQLLIESPVAAALQTFPQRMGAMLAGIKAPSRLRWHLEVDPLSWRIAAQAGRRR
jgi:primosomal protein N' (replication factor Y)